MQNVIEQIKAYVASPEAKIKFLDIDRRKDCVWIRINEFEAGDHHIRCSPDDFDAVRMEFWEYLAQLDPFEELWVRRHTLDYEDMKAFIQVLDKINKLYLFGLKAPVNASTLFYDALANNTNVKYLAFDDMKIQDWNAFARAVNKPGLVDLEIFLIEDLDLPMLLNVLRDLQDFECLSIQRNKLDDSDLRTVAGFLSQNPHLKVLNLMENAYTGVGVGCIAEALKKNSHLLDLQLGYSNIGEDGVLPLADMLRDNTTLTNLVLCGCNLTSRSYQELARALETNRTLMFLSLNENEVDQDVYPYFEKALETNTSLTDLSIDVYPVPPIISQYLSRNKDLTTTSC